MNAAFIIMVIFNKLIVGDYSNGRLGYERGEKYRKYKSDAEPILSDKRKCEWPFKLRGKPISKGEGWVLKVIRGYHNHDLSDTLVGHPFASRLKSNEQSLLVDMTKSQVKPANILLTLKEKDKCNVTTMKQVYNVRYMYERSLNNFRYDTWTKVTPLLANIVHPIRCKRYTHATNSYSWFSQQP